MGEERLSGELSLRALKTRSYLAAFPFAIVGALAAWTLSRQAGQLTAFDQAAFPAMAAALAVLFALTALGALLRWPERVMALIEHTVLVAAMIFFLLRQAYGHHPTLVEDGQAVVSMAHWEAVVFLLIFLILPAGGP